MHRTSNRQKTKGKLSTDGINISLAKTTDKRLLDCVRRHGSTLAPEIVVYIDLRSLEKKWRRNHFDLGELAHEAEYKNVKRPTSRLTKEPIEPEHRFEVTLEPDNFTEEKYALYANYEKNIHHRPPSKVTRNGFRKFLCSGLKRGVQNYEEGGGKRLGSYHQCYRLDGRLVALGVLDLLPDCVSSVYLIYHTSVIDWNFGKLSALQEIALTIEGGYRFYYMGFYIHSCAKMQYKATYHPSYILDPETYAWDLLDADVLARLSARKYVSLSRERALNIPTNSLFSFLQADALTTATFSAELAMGPEAFKQASDYVNGQPHDSAVGNHDRSLFLVDLPGIMTADEVREKIDLGAWKIALGSKVTLLRNLVGWEDSEMTNIYNIKGLAAEFAACIGPELVKETCIKWSR
ncbi:Arginine-tRNA-protein transferase, C-terminal [Lasallia pustulata]|uniref:Arginine-tRNA-protein transferase, C-terminal n=1 Tax=Lasallia pustulata TaxID=136370 RepID=A0A1W5CZ17_9LECA|nr:Arginine-tRNA-protein transferase, C-terminal [Lasallia pustulata]